MISIYNQVTWPSASINLVLIFEIVNFEPFRKKYCGSSQEVSLNLLKLDLILHTQVLHEFLKWNIIEVCNP